MKKFLLATVACLGLSLPASAAQLNVGAGGTFSNILTNSASASQGTAAAAGVASGQNAQIGSGFSTTTPAGSLTAAVGASAGQSNALSGSISAGNGAAANQSHVTNTGLGFGFGAAAP